MTTAGWFLGTFMLLLALYHQIPAPKDKPRRRAGGIGHNRKARR